MSFRTGFTSSSKAFAGLSFNIRLTYLETSWNKLETLGKSVLETISEAWTMTGRRKSVELGTKSAGTADLKTAPKSENKDNNHFKPIPGQASALYSDRFYL
jgi:hypothetical protein